MMEKNIITVFLIDGPGKGKWSTWDTKNGPYIRFAIFPEDFNYNISSEKAIQILPYDEVEYRIIPYLRLKNPYTGYLDHVASINHSLVNL